MHSTFAYHYPPDLIRLVIDLIPLLCRSKRDVLTFFKGAGVPRDIIRKWEQELAKNRQAVKKYDIVRDVVENINEGGDRTLAIRREVLKRIVEFEDFSTCWENDQYKAIGLVAEIRRVINVKDSFTRMKEVKIQANERHVELQQRKQKETLERNKELARIKNDLYALFNETDAQRRGKNLEGVLNTLFSVNSILVKESFTRKGDVGEGIVEQVDGVIELDGHIYLVEMKWHSNPLGVEDIASHLNRIFLREGARGIIISASGFSDPALSNCKEVLAHKVLVLFELEEIVTVLEVEADLGDVIRNKVRAAITEKNPFHPFIRL